ncbi:MAG TPA: DegT/DnrJ/EryC1/StrS family aminotransferase [Candidatus Acidoferrales bacterium]|nr:DegT/DnrJ/EryC1/StrS family aminotransferase [Candidatus Acidoferrales bacterium]
MAYRVPFVDPRKHYQTYKAEIDAAILDCLARGDLIDREDLRNFENSFAAFVGTKYAIGVNSGYHALEFSLRAAGIRPGDEVITVAHTFVATISALVNAAAKPVLVDVAADFNISPESLDSAITPRTRAIIPVSLNGRVCEMDAILNIAARHNVLVIEDSAQALGAEYRGQRAGSFGITGCFSFYPFKMLGGIGDGGAVTTNNAEIAQAIRRMRYNGEDRATGEYHFHGATALLDNVNAAVLDAKLKHVEKWIAHRRKIAALYRGGLCDISELRLPHFDESNRRDVFQNYVIRTKYRDALRQHLASDGIETLVHWPKPVWRHAALRLDDPHLPNAENLCREVLSLPMSAEMTEQQVQMVVESIRSFYVHAHARAARA